MRSYGPTAPKLLPSKVGDSVLAITTLVTRACAVGALKRTTPVNERQQTMAVVENGVLVMRILPGSRFERSFLCRSYRQQPQDGSCAQRYAQAAQHSPVQASLPSLTSSQTIASEPTLSIHQNPNSACAVRLTTATNDSHPQVIASMASARSARLPA